MKPRIKRELLFVEMAWPYSREANDLGREQFYKKQSFGINPVDPDPYYTVLDCGKRWLDLTCDMYSQSYKTGKDWWGWSQLVLDFIHDSELFNIIFGKWSSCKIKLFPGAQALDRELQPHLDRQAHRRNKERRDALVAAGIWAIDKSEAGSEGVIVQ